MGCEWQIAHAINHTDGPFLCVPGRKFIPNFWFAQLRHPCFNDFVPFIVEFSRAQNGPLKLAQRGNTLYFSVSSNKVLARATVLGLVSKAPNNFFWIEKFRGKNPAQKKNLNSDVPATLSPKVPSRTPFLVVTFAISRSSTYCRSYLL